MSSYKNGFWESLADKKFSMLFLTTFIGQIASAFLVLTLIVSLYQRTQSDYAVSGVILSFTIPGMILVAFAGLAADVFDRRKIMVASKLLLTLVVGMIVFFQDKVVTSTLLSTLYFAGNTFFLPAASAASAQVAGKSKLSVANIFFIFTFAGGLIIGFFLTALVLFFTDTHFALLVCFWLLAISTIVAYFLPPLVPKKKKDFSLIATTKDVISSFAYIFSQRKVWYYFLIFAWAQGIIAYAATVAPGFFKQTLNLRFDQALLLVFPLVGIGAFLGGVLIDKKRKTESFFVSFGILTLAFAFIILGGILLLDFFWTFLIFILVVMFLILLGFGDVVVILAARLALQKNIAHNYQGTVFASNIILASLMSSILSVTAAQVVVLWGYRGALFFAGITLAVGYALMIFVQRLWKL